MFFGKLSIEGDDVSASVKAAALNSEVPVTNELTLDPAVPMIDIGQPARSLNLTVYQGSDLDDLLRTSAPGAALDFILQRDRGIGKPTASGSVAAMPGPFGGEAGTTLSYDITLQVTGDVTWGVSV